MKEFSLYTSIAFLTFNLSSFAGGPDFEELGGNVQQGHVSVVADSWHRVEETLLNSAPTLKSITFKFAKGVIFPAMHELRQTFIHLQRFPSLVFVNFTSPECRTNDAGIIVYPPLFKHFFEVQKYREEADLPPLQLSIGD